MRTSDRAAREWRTRTAMKTKGGIVCIKDAQGRVLTDFLPS
jgi:hypothetical protein